MIGLHFSYSNDKLYFNIIIQIKIIFWYCRVQIIDDSIDCFENNDSESNIAEINPVDEFAPQIVGVIDERPQDIQILDKYKNKNRWKRVGDDEDDSSVIDVDQVKNYVQQINKSTLKDLIKKVYHIDKIFHQ